jgi:hypothetical protein
MNIMEAIKNVTASHPMWKILFASIPLVVSCIFLLYLLLTMASVMKECT